MTQRNNLGIDEDLIEYDGYGFTTNSVLMVGERKSSGNGNVEEFVKIYGRRIHIPAIYKQCEITNFDANSLRYKSPTTLTFHLWNNLPSLDGIYTSLSDLCSCTIELYRP